MGLSWDVPPVPNGTMVQDGHLGLNPTCWYNGIIQGCPTCTKRYNGTGWTLGIKALLVVQWDYPGMSHLYQLVQWDCPSCRMSHLYKMVQWYGMDTWECVPLVGTLGLSWDVPPVPNGTMVQDEYFRLMVKQWDYPRMSHLYQMVQWYGMDTWD